MKLIGPITHQFDRNVIIQWVSMLASIAGVESQLQSHLGIAKNQGVTPHHFEEIEKILTEKVSQQVGQRFQKANTLLQD